MLQPCTSPLRTVLDLAEILDPLTLEIAIEDALRCVARILTAGGFPEPVRQLVVPTLDGPRSVDLGYPGRPIVVFEYDSDRWHSGVRRRHADAARRNLLRLSGCVVIEITPAIARDPARLVALVRSAGDVLGAVSDRPGT